MKKYFRKVMVLTSGWALVAAGSVGLFLPALQGVFLIAIGLYILSFESKYIHAIVGTIGKRFPVFARFQKTAEEKYIALFGNKDAT